MRYLPSLLLAAVIFGGFVYAQDRQLLFPAGTAERPGLAVEGDKKTGLFLKDSTTLGFSANGQESFSFTKDQLLVPDGRILPGVAIIPGLAFEGDPTTGLRFDGSQMIFQVGGSTRLFISSTGNLGVISTGDETDPDIGWSGGGGTGFFRTGLDIGITVGGSEVARVDDTTTAGETSLLLWDVDNATLERVSVGIADSGGAGFKVLRILN